MSWENDKDSVDKDLYEWCNHQSKRLKAIYPQMKIQMRNHKLLTQLPGELEHAVKCRCNQNCTLDEIANTLQDIRKRTKIGKLSACDSKPEHKHDSQNTINQWYSQDTTKTWS
ncbi:hypothetical protein O181_109595 [Austropuccinia psidii MF-1]|uniref:Uncharacterized protein n=1 Tax=Austropuccinia psidii MF-1 TaxID=1389203 RepID=A0A9Q3JUQ0_9BASI|nr:hypothetical protein [Austropuccinia psidii MF-1]